MAYLSLDIPPGVVKTGSQVESNGRWRDCNLVRWFQNRLRPVGGWFAETAAMTGAPRTIFTWSLNSGAAQMFIGTNSRIYQWTGGTVLNEIGDSLTGNAEATNGSITGTATLAGSMTTSGSTLTFASGGFDNFLSDLVRISITGGSNAGSYTVTNVVSDTELTIDGTFSTAG